MHSSQAWQKKKKKSLLHQLSQAAKGVTLRLKHGKCEELVDLIYQKLVPQTDLCHISMQVTAPNSKDSAGLGLRTDRQTMRNLFLEA